MGSNKKTKQLFLLGVILFVFVYTGSAAASSLCSVDLVIDNPDIYPGELVTLPVILTPSTYPQNISSYFLNVSNNIENVFITINNTKTNNLREWTIVNPGILVYDTGTLTVTEEMNNITLFNIDVLVSSGAKQEIPVEINFVDIYDDEDSKIPCNVNNTTLYVVRSVSRVDLLPNSRQMLNGSTNTFTARFYSADNIDIGAEVLNWEIKSGADIVEIAAYNKTSVTLKALSGGNAVITANVSNNGSPLKFDFQFKVLEKCSIDVVACNPNISPGEMLTLPVVLTPMNYPFNLSGYTFDVSNDIDCVSITINNTHTNEFNTWHINSNVIQSNQGIDVFDSVGDRTIDLTKDGDIITLFYVDVIALPGAPNEIPVNINLRDIRDGELSLISCCSVNNTTLSVVRSVSRVDLLPNSRQMLKDSTNTFTARFYSEDNLDIGGEVLNWEIKSGANIVEIAAYNKTSVTLKALSGGTAVITANVSNNGSPLKFDFKFEVLEKSYFGINLTINEGWNFVSIPKDLKSGENTVSQVFKNINTDNNSILTYDSLNEKWIKLKAEDELLPLTGYWIYSDADKDVKLNFSLNYPSIPYQRTLYEGWNSIGIYSIDGKPKTVGQAINSYLSGKWTVLYEYSPSIHVLNPNNNDVSLTPGYGIWIYMTSQGTIHAANSV